MTHVAVLAVLGFASYRITRFVVLDDLSKPARERVLRWAWAQKAGKPRQLVGDLVGCTFCAGWWVSLAVLVVYLAATGSLVLSDGGWAARLIEAFAVAGVQIALQGWEGGDE